MTNKITQKIVTWNVKKNYINSKVESLPLPIEPESSIMHEGIKRNDILDGRTYKIKIPSSEHAVYVTINNIDVNGEIHAYELFINCKNPDHQQWIAALTRLISAVLRKGGEVRFIADELMQVFDANGGHWTKKGSNGEKPRFMTSLIAEIGMCLANHFNYIDDLNHIETIRNDIDERMRVFNEEEHHSLNKKEIAIQSIEEESEYPSNAQICHSCKHKSAMLMDGCLTCLACAYSKCG